MENFEERVRKVLKDIENASLEEVSQLLDEYERRASFNLYTVVRLNRIYKKLTGSNHRIYSSPVVEECQKCIDQIGSDFRTKSFCQAVIDNITENKPLEIFEGKCPFDGRPLQKIKKLGLNEIDYLLTFFTGKAMLV